LIIISIVQVLVFIKSNDKPNDKIDETVEINKEILTFKNVRDDLININGLKILEIENKNEVWNAKVLLQGGENKINENLKALKKFKIITYNIDGSNGEFNVTLDIIRKNY
jgi:hypothetical protein